LGARSGSFRDAAEFVDVALIAVLYQEMSSTLAEIGDALRGKAIIDCKNPVEVEHFTLNVYGFTNSDVRVGWNWSAGGTDDGNRALQFDGYGWDQLS
jgi:hypothetical protein